VDRIEPYLEEWLKLKKPGLKASTFDGYRKIVYGQLIPWFGHLTMSGITKRDIKAKFQDLTARNKTLANIQSVLRKSLDDAVEAELIESNPLSNWCYKQAEPKKGNNTIDPFTKDEQMAILASLTGQGRNLIQFAFWTGMRTSELVALDWTDIDFVRGVVVISRAITQKSIVPEGPKTNAGYREIKLLAHALQALRLQKVHTWIAGGEVFQNPQTGQRWAGDQPIRKTLWTWALKKGGVRYRYPYQTRHTYASMMLSSSEHPMWVASQMGHGDWTMIAKVYGKWMPDADKFAGTKAEKLFGGDGQLDGVNDNIAPASSK
jgi:integrase